jgi:hypothetical protein
MKYVYVLVSDENDFYLEQCAFSIFSLKKIMKEAYTLVLSDSDSAERINRSGFFRPLITELRIVDYPNGFSKKEVSRWLKTSMREYVSGDFLYIDCDTIIMDELDSISGLNINLGAVLDNHILLNERFRNPYEKKLLSYRDKKAGFYSSQRVNKFFNGGMVFSRDNQENSFFFKKWHELWLLSNSKKISDDQPAFNQSNFLLGGPIQELDGIWNCQIHYGGLRYFEKVKILHYYNDPRWEKPLYFVDNYFFEKLRKNSLSINELEENLCNIKSFFSNYTRLIADQTILTFLDSTAFSVFRRLFKYQWMISFDMLMSHIFRFLKKIKNGFFK